MNLKMRDQYVLIEEVPEVEKEAVTQAGIILPTTNNDAPAQYKTGIVLGFGSVAKEKEPNLEVGCKVIYSAYSVTYHENYHIIKVENIPAVIMEEE